MNNPFANFPVVFRQDISNRPRINTTMIEDAIEEERLEHEFRDIVIENYKRHIAEQNNEKKRKIDEACKKVSEKLRKTARGKTKKRAVRSHDFVKANEGRSYNKPTYVGLLRKGQPPLGRLVNKLATRVSKLRTGQFPRRKKCKSHKKKKISR